MFKLSLHRIIKPKPETIRVYSRCNDTPLDIFIDVLVNKNYSRLVREGRPLQKEIDSAWQKLWFEYADLTGSSEYRQLFNLIKESALLEGRLTAIRLSLQCISSTQDSSCINILKNYGYKYPFDRSKPDEFASDIQRTFEKSKTIELLINSTRSQIDKINAKSQGTTDYEAYFAEWLRIINKDMGYKQDPKNTTVAEFVRMKKAIEFESERMQQKIHNGK